MTAAHSSGTGLRMGELLGAFAFASDLAFGLEMEDCLRSCYVAVRVAEQLGLSDEERRAAYYATLLKDAGCTCWTSALASFWKTDEIEARREGIIFSDQTLASQMSWMRRFAASGQSPLVRLRTMLEVMTRTESMNREGFASACEVSARIARRLGMPPAVETAVLSMFEMWNGKGGPRGTKADAIPAVSLIVLPAFLFVPFHRIYSRDGAMAMIRKESGAAFSPAVADAFEALASDPGFWHDLEEQPILDLVLSLEPNTEVARVDEGRLDEVALAFADFVDLKSPHTAAHSRRVGSIAEQIGALIGMSEADRRLVRRTALIHDLGLVAVPTFYIDKPEGRRNEAEREALRLHPYHGERVLGRVPGLAGLAAPVGAHHERFDGSGYFRGLKGKDIPLAARVTAVADRLDELTHERPGAAARELEMALKALIADSGTAFDPDIVYAVAGSLGAIAPRPRPAEWPAGLTDREVEVLRLAAKGITRKDIGGRLGISENTVRHHLEHIYDKTGTSTRVSATLFAIENDLVE